CLVTGYEPLIESLQLPDSDDRLLAAAIRARAQVIVTSNLRDFPRSVLADWDIEAKSPDDFVVDQIHLDRKVVWSCAQQIADSWRNPPGTVGDVLSRLERSGLVQAVAELRSE
ncbi:MAG TPA: PIN domain-containing protein, partial [Thermobifida alba]|nr:PIN domain-containing protein [Thermobifida alba]